MKKQVLGFHSLISEEIADQCVAGNTTVADAVNQYLAMHPHVAAEYNAATLRNEVYDLMIENSLED